MGYCRAFVLVFLGGLLACTGYESEFASQQSGIIGGIPSSASDYPATGAIIGRASMGSMRFGTLICTGTLIAPDTVLTAAHCASSFLEMLGISLEYFFTFSVDISNFESDPSQLPADTYPFSELIGHPDFSLSGGGGQMQPMGLGNFYDIGLGFLSQEVVNKTPAVLMQIDDGQFLLVDTSVEIAGYGVTQSGGMMGGIKYHADSVINEVASAELQIGNQAPTAQKCHGDSGGPTFLEVNDGLEPSQRLISVTSRAYDERDCDFGGVDTRVDFFRSWLSDEMTKACTEGRRISCANGGAPSEPGGGGGMPQPDAGLLDTGFGLDTGGSTPGIDAGVSLEDSGASSSLDAQTSTTSQPRNSTPARRIRTVDEDCGCHNINRNPRGQTSAVLLAGLGLIFCFCRRGIP